MPFLYPRLYLISVNLQFNKPWFAGVMGQTNRCPSVLCSKYSFFIVSYRLRALKIYKKDEMIFAKNYARFYEKNDTWNIRRLVNELFAPLAQQTSILYWRLSDFCPVRSARLWDYCCVSFWGPQNGLVPHEVPLPVGDLRLQMVIGELLHVLQC